MKSTINRGCSINSKTAKIPEALDSGFPQTKSMISEQWFRRAECSDVDMYSSIFSVVIMLSSESFGKNARDLSCGHRTSDDLSLTGNGN